MQIFSRWLVYILLLLVGSLVGCGDKNAEKNLIEKPNLLLSGVGFAAKPAMLSVKDQAFLLLGGSKGVVLYTIGQELIVSPDKAGNQWLHYDGKSLYAFWWVADENKAKSLKVAVSSDDGKTFSTPVTINTNTGALPDVSISSNSKGNIAIAYTDEREPGYGVYFNQSNDSGKTWSSIDTRLDAPVLTSAMVQEGNTKPATFANSPKLAFLQDKLLAIWQQVDTSQMGGYILRIVSKTSLDNGKTWGSEANVFAAPNMQPVEMVIFENKKQVYVFAMLTEGDKGFTGFYNKDDTFSSWGEIPNTGLGTGFNKQLISWIKGTFSGDNLILAFTSEPSEKGLGIKVHAETATLSTSSQSWLGSSRILDQDKGHNLTKSTYPDIVSVGSNVYVIWEDYRTLAPSIYMDISKDSGKTWLPAPIPLTTPGLSLSKDPRLLVDEKQLWLTYFLVELNGTNSSGQRAYQTFPKEGDSFKFPAVKVDMPSPEELKTRLIERANKFWALREERKWAETWDYMDPVYRERFEKEPWVAQQGKISFSKTVVDENSVVITGNIGILDANVDVSVAQQVGKEGLLESAPPKQQKVGMRWGWFYDDWYFMPKVIFGEHMEY